MDDAEPLVVLWNDLVLKRCRTAAAAQGRREPLMSNPLQDLARLGQGLWSDDLQRGPLLSGELARSIREDGLTGLSSHPDAYERAITAGTDYDAALAALLPRADLDAKAIYQELAIHDVQMAADLLRPVYQRTARRDGYASLEISPALARDAAATLAEALRLWLRLGRENVLIKIPGTPEALPAIRALLAEGVNVDVTQLFSRHAFEGAARAHLAALEERADRGQDVTRVASVASFAVSRVDSMVDGLLDHQAASDPSGDLQARAEALRGQVGMANAKLAYQDWLSLAGSPRWDRLRALGAMPQRLLWEDTGSLDPGDRDVRYAEGLIGPDTVDTMPPATLEAFRDHGRARPTLQAGVEEAQRTVNALAALGIALGDVTERLLVDGLWLLRAPFARLLRAIEARRDALLGRPAAALP